MTDQTRKEIRARHEADDTHSSRIGYATIAAEIHRDRGTLLADCEALEESGLFYKDQWERADILSTRQAMEVSKLLAALKKIAGSAQPYYEGHLTSETGHRMLRIARAALAQSGNIQKKAREAAGDILDGPFDPDDYEAWPEPDEESDES